jgi:transcriptional regulator with XRE-family HTH domain
MELTEFQQRFGKHVRSARDQKKWSITKLSKLTGISKTHLKQMEQGECNACLDSIRRLHLALGLPLDMFDSK